MYLIDTLLSFYGDIMNITVYLGASTPNDIKYFNECKKLGKLIGTSGYKLIYGGSKCGLMGILADSVIENGGYVVGIEPKMFIDKCEQHEKLNEFIITDDILDRKRKMLELGDIYIAFPGGSGTLSEITEAMDLLSLQYYTDEYVNKKCIFYNFEGYYNEIKELLHKMEKEGFTNKDRIKDIYFVDDIEELDKILKQ